MDNRPILTIAIPTYNRWQYLKECLNHICPQATDEVCVVVRDNCSTNYDFNMSISPYVEKYNIHTYVNRTNIGGDANTARLFEMCETEWLWVIGDDDYIAPDAISMVLDVIKKEKDCIYIKFNSKFTGKVYGIEGFTSAMKDYGAFGYSFFTSECIYNLKNDGHNMFWHYRYLSTYSPQILRVMCDLIDDSSKSCLFIGDQILKNHGEEISWTRVDIVSWQLNIFDIFWDQRNLFKDNVFRDIASYSMIYVDSSNISSSHKRYLYRQIISKYGIINLIRYNFVQIIRIPLRMILPKSIYMKVKRVKKRR